MIRSSLAAGLCAAVIAFVAPQETPAAKKDEPRVERIAAPTGTDAKKRLLPDAVPEPFAKLLDDKTGVRLVGADGKALCNLWIRTTIATNAKAAPGGVKLGRLVPGSFVGVLSIVGEACDYRDQPIEAGLYALRYFVQPSDGNHLGTADTRDFLLLTKFEQDRDPAPIATQEKLVEFALAATTGTHAHVLYVAAIPEAIAAEKPAADGLPRLFQRPKREEWALDLSIAAEKAGDDPIRFGLVLIGHTPG